MAPRPVARERAERPPRRVGRPPPRVVHAAARRPAGEHGHVVRPHHVHRLRPASPPGPPRGARAPCRTRGGGGPGSGRSRAPGVRVPRPRPRPDRVRGRGARAPRRGASGRPRPSSARRSAIEVVERGHGPPVIERAFPMGHDEEQHAAGSRHAPPGIEGAERIGNVLQDVRGEHEAVGFVGHAGDVHRLADEQPARGAVRMPDERLVGGTVGMAAGRRPVVRPVERGERGGRRAVGPWLRRCGWALRPPDRRGRPRPPGPDPRSASAVVRSVARGCGARSPPGRPRVVERRGRSGIPRP